MTTDARPPTLAILLLLSAALLVAFFSGYELLDRTVFVTLLSGEARELVHGLSGIFGAILLTIFIGWNLVRYPVHDGRIEQLRWLVQMRWIAAAFSLALIVITVPVMRIVPVDQLPALLVWTGVMAAANLFFARVTGRSEHFDRQIMTQMMIDTVVVTGLLHASGGFRNPMSVVYLFGVFIAAILLPKTKALAVTLMIAAALTFLIAVELLHDPVVVLARLASVLAVMFLTSYFTTMVMDRPARERGGAARQRRQRDDRAPTPRGSDRGRRLRDAGRRCARTDRMDEPAARGVDVVG